MNNVILSATRIVRESEKAILAEFPAARLNGDSAEVAVWLPKSAVKVDGLKFEMPAYIAREKGIEQMGSSTKAKKAFKW